MNKNAKLLNSLLSAGNTPTTVPPKKKAKKKTAKKVAKKTWSSQNGGC